MQSKLAGGIHYFGENGFPIALRRVSTDNAHSPSHPHDLTEVEHRHDFCELAVVTHGQAMHCLEGDKFPVSAGDVFLLQGRQSHYFFDRKDLGLINIMYDPEKLNLPEGELRKLPGYCALFILEPTYRRQHRFASRLHLKRVALAHAERMAEKIEKEYTEQKLGWEVSMQAALLELVVYLSRSYSETGSTEAHALLRVGNVIGALEHDFTKDWKLEELVDISHMSRSSLMRVFRIATGQTPIEYLIRLRIQRAMELLRGSELNISEIAHMTGFNDSNYFSRQFRKALNMSPRQFRTQSRI